MAAQTLRSLATLLAVLCVENSPGLHAQTGTVVVKLVDEGTGRPTYGRVMVSGHFKDDAVRAEGQKPFKVGAGLAWVVPETLTLTVPVGDVRLTAERGTEYRSVSARFWLKEGESITREIRLTRWIDMKKRGWYSGEVHIHFTADEVRAQILAEDVNVGTTLVRWVSKDDRYVASPIIDPVRIVNDHTTYSINDMEVERFPIDAYEAPVYLVGLRQQIHLDAPTPAWPLNLEYQRRAQAQGGVVCAHSAAFDDVAVGVALGTVDAIGLANNFFGYAYSVVRTRRYGNADDLEEFGDTVEGTYRMVLGKYYRLLNCGFRVPASSCSASGIKPNPTGFNRTYVELTGSLTYADFMQGLKAGRSFVTNGPMLFLEVAGCKPGRVLELKAGSSRVAAKVSIIANEPLARLNVVHNGRAIKIVDLRSVQPGREWVWEGMLDLDDHTGWIAAHVEAASEWIRFAHTSPIWIEHPQSWASTRDAAYFAKWTRHRIAELPSDPGFLKEHHRSGVRQTLEKAALVYEKLAGAAGR